LIKFVEAFKDYGKRLIHLISASIDRWKKREPVQKKGTDSKETRFLQRANTIRFKLTVAFLVPIAFIILLGFVSFQRASETIVSNYEKATLQAIEMAGEYLRFGFESVESTSIQYMNDESITKYFLGSYKEDSIEYTKSKKTIDNLLSTKQTADDFIEDIYLIADKVDSVTTKKSFESGIYAGFLENEIGQFLKKNRTKMVWIGQNDYLDEKLGTEPEEYSMRLVRNLASAEALMIIDVKADTVNKILSDLEFDQSGFLTIVTSDGKEIIAVNKGAAEASDTTENSVEEGSEITADDLLTGETFYQDAVLSEEPSGSLYVEYKGENYLFMYSKVGMTGAMICALMPKEHITSQADSIKLVTVVTVIVACIVAVIIGVGISSGIGSAIKEIITRLKKAAKGDLTVVFNTTRKDEFNVLATEIQNTFTNMKKLIQQVKDLSSEVKESSAEVSHTSELFLKTSEGISNAMNEIEQGVSQQAKDAEECLLQMDNLSQKIEHVSDNTKEIGQIADKARGSIQGGTVVTQDLNKQTKSTIEITTSIINEIENLATKSMSISKIIEVINEIANQTNLLSLNASIEAARAGEFGKGFSVVASEIRNLAEQSKNSVNDIKKIIGSIQDGTKNAVEIARKAEDVLQLQEDAVKNTTESYKNINESVEQLMVYLNYISENVSNIEEARVSTLGAIENISAVLEEIAASSNTVNQTSNDQLTSVGTLNNSASKLNEDAEQLVDEVSKFIV